MSATPLHSTADPAAGHVTVLRDEAVSALSPVARGTYLDGTFGGGGHTSRLLAWEPPVGKVIALDADLDAASRAEAFATALEDPARFIFARGNFRDLSSILDGLGVPNLNGALFDLGVSSYQFDEGDRGFSFRTDAPLDMRFDQSAGAPAATLVNTMSERDLADLIWRYGDERQSRQIAAAIVRIRDISPIASTGQLAQIVEKAVGGRRGKSIHPATRTFQALRIAVNDELGALERVLGASVDRLVPGGRLVVISFHSLEDRIVKRFLEAESRTCVCPPSQPVCTCDTVPRVKRIGRAVRPDNAEQQRNPRSRSAIMRVAERLGPIGETDGRGTYG